MLELSQNIKLIGIVTELTRSQSKNFDIIQKHWILFNNELRFNMLSQSKTNWTKYGIVYKYGSQYFYAAAIPFVENIKSSKFRQVSIHAGKYESFTHKGNLLSLKNTIYNIFKEIVPKSNIKLNTKTENRIIYFEKYDYKFNWNKNDSEIKIYLAIDS
ncbi:MAG: GyrI-like domain-containing protein [Marinifilaceae bacterium]|jgi:predicted transcriptional regulator YdeE|nr:GyrI-like domain-containing protein [Marinifilaceae bacterium]